jgi:hypothetical protein
MEQGQKIVFRDGAAGGFEPAPLNRRCLPETTSPPRGAGATERAVTNQSPRKERQERVEAESGARKSQGFVQKPRAFWQNPKIF